MRGPSFLSLVVCLILSLASLVIPISSTSLADMTPSFFSERKDEAESVAPFLKTLQMCGRADTLEAYLNATLDLLQMCGASKSQLDEIHQILAKAEPFDYCESADRMEKLIKQRTALTHNQIIIEKTIIRREKERVANNSERASCVAVTP
jgi:hypothetical protein